MGQKDGTISRGIGFRARSSRNSQPEEIPIDVITMNSTFRLSGLDSGEEVVYTLVFPAKADSRNGKISILAPLGARCWVIALETLWSGKCQLG
jgi:hypothetical protein